MLPVVLIQPRRFVSFLMWQATVGEQYRIKTHIIENTKLDEKCKADTFHYFDLINFVKISEFISAKESNKLSLHFKKLYPFFLFLLWMIIICNYSD